MGDKRRRVVITATDVMENMCSFLNTKRYESAKAYNVVLAPGARYRPALDPGGQPGFVLGPCFGRRKHVEEGLFMAADDAYLFWLQELLKSEFE